MISRLSLFCWGLSYNMWEKKVDSGLKSINVRGEAIALLLMSEEKGGCAQAFLKEVWVRGMKKELVHFQLWCLCQSGFFGCKWTEPTLTIIQECGRTVVSSSYNQKGQRRNFTKGQELGQSQETNTAMIEHQLVFFFCLSNDPAWSCQSQKHLPETRAYHGAPFLPFPLCLGLKVLRTPMALYFS